MNRQDHFIASYASWDDFWERAKKLSAHGEKALRLSVSHNYICKPHQNINPNSIMCGCETCLPTFAACS